MMTSSLTKDACRKDKPCDPSWLVRLDGYLCKESWILKSAASSSAIDRNVRHYLKNKCITDTLNIIISQAKNDKNVIQSKPIG